MLSKNSSTWILTEGTFINSVTRILHIILLNSFFMSMFKFKSSKARSSSSLLSSLVAQHLSRKEGWGSTLRLQIIICGCSFALGIFMAQHEGSSSSTRSSSFSQGSSSCSHGSFSRRILPNPSSKDKSLIKLILFGWSSGQLVFDGPSSFSSHQLTFFFSGFLGYSGRFLLGSLSGPLLFF